TVIGLLGAIFMVVGLVFCFRNYGNEVGFYVLMGTLVTMLGAMVYSFRSGAWSRFSLKTAIESKVNEDHVAELKTGDEGMTVSTLRPNGKANFNDEQYEVKTVGAYVDAGTRVKIIEIRANEIIVEPIN